MSAIFGKSSGPGLARTKGRRGFTLIEMLISLAIGVMIVGGVMGVISVSMQYKYRLKEKSRIQPILETAAQAIMADPGRIAEGSIKFGKVSGSPVVGISAVPVGLPDGVPARNGQLYRVMLDYRGQDLEFSLLVPPDANK